MYVFHVSWSGPAQGPRMTKDQITYKTKVQENA